jgi:tRNA synthetases class I (R)
LEGSEVQGERVENVLDAVCAVLERHDLADDSRVSVPHHPGRRELSLFGLSQASPERTAGALREIGELDSIGNVSIGKRERVSVRLSDRCVTDLGEMLEAGVADPLRTEDLGSGRQVVVDFCDPNATKALHVGHLRNIALGNAVAAVLRACGATVLTQSQVGDVGRSVGEAMAGYEQYGGGKTPLEQCEKSDHFVGSCYSSYVRAAADAGPAAEALASDPALSREDEEHDDLASELIERWHRGDPDAVALWRKVRDWAVDGQAETLGRLAVSVDRVLFESDFLAEIGEVGDRLVEAGVAEVTVSGAVLFSTGDSSYSQLVLRRPDGHSTQYLRYLALWDATRSILSPGDSIQVLGDEWLSLVNASDNLLGQLAGGGDVHPTDCLVHGMVTVDDQVVKSSLTTPWLADSLLDEIAADAEIARASAGDPDSAARLTATTALGMFIADPPGKRLSISREALFDPAANPGWAMVAATIRAWDPRYDGAPDPSVSDRDYRFLIAQSQVHRQLVRRSYEELNPIHVARFHSHLCRWFLRTPCTPRLCRAMRTVTSAGISSLGLQPPFGDSTTHASHVRRPTGLEPASAA